MKKRMRMICLSLGLMGVAGVIRARGAIEETAVIVVIVVVTAIAIRAMDVAVVGVGTGVKTRTITKAETVVTRVAARMMVTVVEVVVVAEETDRDIAGESLVVRGLHANPESRYSSTKKRGSTLAQVRSRGSQTPRSPRTLSISVV
jgi:hypothetical protein